MAHWFHKAPWDGDWEAFVTAFSEWSGHEGSKDVGLQPTWFLSLYLRSIQESAPPARRYNSPLCRVWEFYDHVALVLLDMSSTDVLVLAEAQPAGDAAWTLPMRAVASQRPRPVWQALLDCFDAYFGTMAPTQTT